MSKLKIWWIPNPHTLGKDKKQGKRTGPFEREVSSIEEAILLLNFIADYDLYLGDDLISSNAGGLIEFVDGEWLDYESPQGYSIDDFMNDTDLLKELIKEGHDLYMEDEIEEQKAMSSDIKDEFFYK